MSLKLKVITLISTIFVIYGLAGSIIQSYVILPIFMEMERTEANNNSDRLLEALDREVNLLIPSATDWGTWDDTYNYMADRNETFTNSNLNAISLESLKVNFLGIYESDGRKVWGLAYDLDSAEPIDLGEFSIDTLAEGHPLMGSPGAQNTVAGLYTTPRGPMMVVSRPILPTSINGASRGRIVMGRLLNDKALSRLSDQAKVRIRYNLPEPNRRSVFDPINRTGYLVHSPIELSETSGSLLGKTILFGLNNARVLSLEMDTPRTISAQGKRTLNYAIWYLISSGIIVLLFLLLLLRYTLFLPLAKFLRHVTEIGTKGDLTTRIAMNRKDEIGILADQFDRMVILLSEARQKLLDQSYQSGMAEIASGVLHNLGNAVTPIGIKLSKVKQDLQRSPFAEVEMAVAELTAPDVQADRRANLTQFLQLAGSELAVVIKRTANEIKGVQAQLDYINKILADQQCFSRAERVLETLQPLPLINEIVQLLPDDLLQGISVVIQPKLAQNGNIRFAKVAFQQVIGNLFINAAESIRQSPNQDNGLIRISGAQETREGKPMLHLIIEDNGAGITPENMSHLFERSFSTKARGSGLGLHWSANTVASLGGRLYAESPGHGGGATFHLLLPLEPLLDQPCAQEIAA